MDKIYVVKQEPRKLSYEEVIEIIKEMADLGMVKIINDFDIEKKPRIRGKVPIGKTYGFIIGFRKIPFIEMTVKLVGDIEARTSYTITDEFLNTLIERTKKEYGAINKDNAIRMLIRLILEFYNKIITIGTKEFPIGDQDLIIRAELLWSAAKKSLYRKGFLNGNKRRTL